MAPPTKPKMATSEKRIKYHVGNNVVSAPIGSIAIASDNFASLVDKAAP